MRLHSALNLIATRNFIFTRTFSKSSSTSRVRGTHDYFSDDDVYRDAIRSIFISTVQSHGYIRVETPVLEHASLFLRTLGEGSDVVSKEMYSFHSPKSIGNGNELESDSSSLLCLRPEGTAGIMRSLISSGRLKRSLHPLSQRYFYEGPMFRHERPQKGRFREFSQLGIELIGGKSSQSDSEAIALAHTFLTRLFFVDPAISSCTSKLKLQLSINTIGDEEGRERYLVALRSFLEENKASLSTESQGRLDRGQSSSIFRILDSKSTLDQDILSKNSAPKLDKYLSSQSLRRFENVLYNVCDLGITPVIDSKLVRGLDYYSDTVFEFVIASDTKDGTEGSSGHLGTVLAGGRYDQLSKVLGNSEPIPSIGWAAGLERLSILLSSPSLQNSSGLAAMLRITKGPLRIAILPIISQQQGGDSISSFKERTQKSIESSGLKLAMLIPTLLTQEHLILHFEPDTKLGKLLSCAVTAKADVAIIIGETELEKGIISVKNLKTSTQVSVALPWLDNGNELVKELLLY
jgi:histidyl-tRNA synthetase